MGLSQSIVRGLKLAVSSPKLLLLLWLTNLLYALPASLMMREALVESFAESLVSHGMLESFDLGWQAEFEATGGGFEETLTPTVSGPGPVFDNLEAWWSGELFSAHPGLVGLGIGYMILWAFLLGGILDFMSRRVEGFDRESFFAASGRFLPTFLGLGVLSGAVYLSIFKLARWSYSWIEKSSRDVTEERTVMMWVLMAAAVACVLLSLTRMVFDYAKIAAVVEQRKGVLGSLAVALRFVFRQPLSSICLYGSVSILGLTLLAFYAWLAPGVGQATPASIALALLSSQIYLVGRLVVRLGLLGAQASFFRARKAG